MLDITELKARLNRDVLGVCQHLLPNGKKIGHEWCVGSVRGEAGESLKVELRGHKAGLWCDFAPGGESGDIIELWRQARGLSLGDALDDIRTHLGVERPEFEPRQRKTYRRPEKPKCRVPQEAVLDYLREDRNLSAEAIKTYRVAEQGREIVFPSLVGEDLVFVKYLSVDRSPEGKKITRVESGCEPVLFGWQAIPPDAREIVITEGEVNAMSAWQYDYPALATPFGAGGGRKQAWIENEFERLAQCETIWLSFDRDEAGHAALDEIIPRLGRHRCRVIRLPNGDFNDCLVNGVGKEVIDQCVRDAATRDPEELRAASEFTEDVIKLFYPDGEREPGYRLPWKKIGDNLVFRPSELTLWSAGTSEGKTQVLGHTVVDIMNQGGRCCLASFEMKSARLLKRMVKQVAGTDRPTQDYIGRIMNWLGERCWIFDRLGHASVDALLEVFEYCRRRYGTDVFVIDSFMRLGIGPDDYAAQDQAMMKLVDWVTGHPVHLHLVAHSRKVDIKAKGRAPDRDDVKGASEIAANAFNIITIWRDRDREENLQQLEKAEERGDAGAVESLAEARAEPTVILNTCKQRNGDWEGKIGLWFDPSTYRYRSSFETGFHDFRYMEPNVEPLFDLEQGA